MHVRAAVLGLILILALPGAAAAKSKTLTGKIGQISDARISLKVAYDKKGKPTKVSKVKITRLSYRCPQIDARGELNFGIPGTFTPAGRTLRFRKTATIQGRVVRFKGNFEFSPKVVQGEVDVKFTQSGARCVNGSIGFTAR